MELKYSEVVGRLLRQDEPNQLGASTLKKAFEALDRGESEEAKRIIEYARLEWEVVHDIYVRWIWAFLTFVANELGEEAIEEAMRFVMASYYRKRYDKVMAADVKTQLQLTIEGLRGHLFGPERMGEVTVVEEEKRYKLIFEPCGSGGIARKRIMEGEEHNSELFGFSRKAHSWTWGKENVCYYCAHCAMVNEILAIENYGHPMRITEYDGDPSGRCVWYIYKDPKDIPAEYYERVGKKAPQGAPRLGDEITSK